MPAYVLLCLPGTPSLLIGKAATRAPNPAQLRAVSTGQHIGCHSRQGQKLTSHIRNIGPQFLERDHMLAFR